MVVLGVAMLATACAPTLNLPDPAGPKFEGRFAPAASGAPAAAPVRVVTFNIKLGREIDRAVEVLQSDSLRGADVVALQEMDEVGVARIARALGLNYVYYPGVIHPTDHRFFGPALLTPWPIERSWKLALPHLGRFRHQQRIATAAVVRVRGQPIQVYAVHLEAQLRVSAAQRADQVRTIIADAKQDSEHDFGRNVIPTMVRSQRRIFAFDIVAHSPAARHYWQDVGTLDSYFDAHMELLLPQPAFDLFDPSWPIRTHAGQYPPALMRNAGEREARAVNSIVSPGCIVSGGTVVHSVLSPQVLVGAGATVEESILMPGVRVGEGTHIRRAIVDENVHIPAAVTIGGDHDDDRRRFAVTPGGVVIVPEGTLMA